MHGSELAAAAESAVVAKNRMVATGANCVIVACGGELAAAAESAVVAKNGIGANGVIIACGSELLAAWGTPSGRAEPANGDAMPTDRFVERPLSGEAPAPGMMIATAIAVSIKTLRYSRTIITAPADVSYFYRDVRSG